MVYVVVFTYSSFFGRMQKEQSNINYFYEASKRVDRDKWKYIPLKNTGSKIRFPKKKKDLSTIMIYWFTLSARILWLMKHGKPNCWTFLSLNVRFFKKREVFIYCIIKRSNSKISWFGIFSTTSSQNLTFRKEKRLFIKI